MERNIFWFWFWKKWNVEFLDGKHICSKIFYMSGCFVNESQFMCKNTINEQHFFLLKLWWVEFVELSIIHLILKITRWCGCLASSIQTLWVLTHFPLQCWTSCITYIWLNVRYWVHMNVCNQIWIKEKVLGI